MFLQLSNLNLVISLTAQISTINIIIIEILVHLLILCQRFQYGNIYHESFQQLAETC